MPTLETERLMPRLGSGTAWTGAETRVRDRGKPASGRGPVLSFVGDRNGMLDRPKSTPGRTGQQSRLSQYQPQQRPHTSTGDAEECARVLQVGREPVRRHRLTSSLPVKRAKPQSALPPTPTESTQNCFQVGPGYVMYRTKSKISMNINADEFWGKEEKRPESVKHVEEDYKDALIAQLQDQVNDLKLFLEEEKLNHRDTIARCAEELRTRMADITAQHLIENKLIEERHAKQIEDNRLRFEEELQRERKEAEEMENKLRQDIDFLHASFESYKSALAVEVQDRLKEKEEELRKEFEYEKQNIVQDLRITFNREKMLEKAQWQQEANREMEKMRMEHKKELDTLARKFADAQALLEKLNRTSEELTKKDADLQALREEHEFLQEEKARLISQLRSAEIELERTQSRLQQFQDAFEERVKRVDEQYRLKIEGLQRQSIDLRRAYMAKCGELVDEKTRGESQLNERLETAKDAMRNIIGARNRAALSIAALDEDEEGEKRPFSRPLSAPITEPERQKARECAGEAKR